MVELHRMSPSWLASAPRSPSSSTLALGAIVGGAPKRPGPVERLGESSLSRRFQPHRSPPCVSSPRPACEPASRKLRLRSLGVPDSRPREFASRFVFLDRNNLNTLKMHNHGAFFDSFAHILPTYAVVVAVWRPPPPVPPAPR